MAIGHTQLPLFPDWACPTCTPAFAERDLGLSMEKLIMEREQHIALLSGGDTWLAWFLTFRMNIRIRKLYGWFLTGYSVNVTHYGILLTLRVTLSAGGDKVAFYSGKTLPQVMGQVIKDVKQNKVTFKEDKPRKLGT